MTRVAALRERLQWSQAKMADFVGLSQAAISNLENGTSEKGPLAMVLDRLAVDHGWPDLTAELYGTQAGGMPNRQPKDAA